MANNRREFIHAAGALAATTAGAALQGSGQAPGGAGPATDTGRGGAAAHPGPDRARRCRSCAWAAGTSAPSRTRRKPITIMHAAIDEGLTFFDNAWDYHDGGSEEVMGKALAAGRASATEGLPDDQELRAATPRAPRKHLEDSLRRLQTDLIDLWQFHEINYDNDPDWIVEKGGLAEALEAQEGGQGPLHRLHRPQVRRTST